VVCTVGAVSSDAPVALFRSVVSTWSDSDVYAAAAAAGGAGAEVRCRVFTDVCVGAVVNTGQRRRLTHRAKSDRRRRTGDLQRPG